MIDREQKVSVLRTQARVVAELNCLSGDGESQWSKYGLGLHGKCSKIERNQA